MKKLLFEKVDIPIRDLTIDGDGIGDFNGFTIFVPGALPSEQVTVKLKKVKKNYGLAKLIHIKKKSSQREDPLCPYFGKCGGCQIMHLSYDGQLRVKEERIKQAFIRTGKIKPPDNFTVVASPKIQNYRNKIQLPFFLKNERLCVGLYAKASHDIISIDRCLIHNMLGEAVIPKILHVLERYKLKPFGSSGGLSILRHLLIRTALKNKQLLVVLITHSKPLDVLKLCADEIMQIDPSIKGVVHHENTRVDNVILDQKFTLLSGREYIIESLNQLNYKISAPSFFQVNSHQAENLYKTALEFGELTQEDIVIDAYSGIGSLTLFLAPHVKKIFGIEYVKKAVSDAEENAVLNGITNALMYAGDVKDLLFKVEAPNVVYLNPPRKGCDAAVIEQIIKLAPRAIVYISCDPMTLARDAGLLCAHGYSLTALRGFDMFPQTMHVETCACFKYNPS